MVDKCQRQIARDGPHCELVERGVDAGEALKTGAQPDLIKLSKQNLIRGK